MNIRHPTKAGLDRALISPARTAFVLVVTIALAEIVAMIVLDRLKPPQFWPATLLDATIMTLLILPPLWLLVFRPMARLLEERRLAGEELGKRARRLEAIAAENESLLIGERASRLQADTLRDASLAITRTLDLESIFAALLGHLGGVVSHNRAEVMILDSGSRLRVRAVLSPSGELEFCDDPFDSFDGENASVMKVMKTGRSVCVPDTRAEPEWGGRAEDVARSWLGVPFLAAGEAFGLVTIAKSEPHFFTPASIRLAEALCAPASMAIANARLFAEVREGQEQLRRISRKLVEAVEGERLKIARELHDEAGQLLTSLTVGLRLLEHEAGRPEAVLAHAAELMQIAHTAQEGLHRLASDLRPAALDHLGLVPALGQLAAKVQRRDGREGPVIRLETVGFDGGRVSPLVEIAFFRIAQEALTNALRHARARRISVVLTKKPSRIVMVVEDDGRGFDVDAASRSDRLGLPGIRERAEMLGGSLLVESTPGLGTTLVVEAPDAA
jgi:signal transduction histidine kinase